MTLLGGDYEPAKVEALDLVGYQGNGVFAILVPSRHCRRNVPELPDETQMGGIPLCIRARIENNQVVNFSGEVATLHDIDGKWHFKPRGSRTPKPLAPHTFFEVGDAE